MLSDELTLVVEGGHGGAGSRSFRKEKYIEFGGPDGGDGGRGGSIFVRVNPHLRMLNHLKSRPFIKAEDGNPGRGKKRSGKCGQDLILEVPLGTIVKDEETARLLIDLDNEHLTYKLVSGGLGGKGNIHFRSALCQAPRYAQHGVPGERKSLKLELKIIADVGLVGVPNAGKSTLLSRVSRSSPKVASYPFTTLVPHLGVVYLEDYVQYVMADIPGLIEGAHEGAGLGIRFLKHVERTRVLLFVLDVSADPVQQFRVVMNELRYYSLSLSQKSFALVLNKMDMVGVEAEQELRETFDTILPAEGFEKVPVFFVSAWKREGVELLKREVWKFMQSQ